MKVIKRFLSMAEVREMSDILDEYRTAIKKFVEFDKKIKLKHKLPEETKIDYDPDKREITYPVSGK